MTARRSALTAFIAGSIVVVPSVIVPSRAETQAYREFRHVADVAEIRQARGLVFGANVRSSDPVATTYYVSGEWVLNCGGPCQNAPLGNIMFDLSHGMITTDGSTSQHAHQYSDFRATSVTLTPDTSPGDADNSKLTIVGTITLHKTGSNQSVGITLELFRPTTAGIFSFTLSGTTHIESKISGMIVESER
jgi:hypothetical protein